MPSKIFVGNLPFKTDSAQLEEEFAAFGTVLSAKIITDKGSGRSKGFGFVEFSEDDAAQKAVDEKNGCELDGRKLTVNLAKKQA